MHKLAGIPIGTAALALVVAAAGPGRFHARLARDLAGTWDWVAGGDNQLYGTLTFEKKDGWYTGSGASVMQGDTSYVEVDSAFVRGDSTFFRVAMGSAVTNARGAFVNDSTIDGAWFSDQGSVGTFEMRRRKP